MKLLTRISLLVTLLTLTGIAGAQSWDHVKKLPVDTELHINLQHGSLVCDFIAADEKSIACNTHKHVFIFTIHQRLVFQRDTITRIRLSRSTLSTLAGAGIGAAAGAGIGAGIDASEANKAEEAHIAAVLLGLLGAGLGATLGNHTDFLAGSTIYMAP